MLITFFPFHSVLFRLFSIGKSTQQNFLPPIWNKLRVQKSALIPGQWKNSSRLTVLMWGYHWKTSRIYVPCSIVHFNLFSETWTRGFDILSCIKLYIVYNCYILWGSISFFKCLYVELTCMTCLQMAFVFWFVFFFLVIVLIYYHVYSCILLTDYYIVGKISSFLTLSWIHASLVWYMPPNGIWRI